MAWARPSQGWSTKWARSASEASSLPNLALPSVPRVPITPTWPVCVSARAGLSAGSRPTSGRPGWRWRSSSMAAAVAVLQATTSALIRGCARRYPVMAKVRALTWAAARSPEGALALSARYTKRSRGNAARSACSTLRPPTPLSNTPMGCCCGAALAPRLWPCSGGCDTDALEFAGVDALLPVGGAGDVDVAAAGVHGDSHRHVDHVEFVDRLHAQVGKAHHFGALDGLAHQVGGAAHGHQVGALVLFDGPDGDRAALGFADHRDQAGPGQHHVGELVHPGGGGGACGAYGLALDRVHRADVVDDPVVEVHRQLFAVGQQVLYALVRGIAAGQHLAVEQQAVAGLPSGALLPGQLVEKDPAAVLVVGRPVHVGPQVQTGGRQVGRA